MSAYEEIRNKLSKKDKNGFSLWKKVVAGMMAGGKLKIEMRIFVKLLKNIIIIRYRTTDGLPHRPDKNPNTDGRQKKADGGTTSGEWHDGCFSENPGSGRCAWSMARLLAECAESSLGQPRRPVHL